MKEDGVSNAPSLSFPELSGALFPTTDPLFATGQTYVGTSGDDDLTGTADDDTFILSAGNDRIDGLGGFDTFDMSGSSGSVGIGIRADGIRAEDTTAVNVERFILSDFNDTFDIGRISNFDLDFTIDGGAGNDLLAGASGDDTLIGGTGDDRFRSSAGRDSYDGGEGTDLVFFTSPFSFSRIQIDLLQERVVRDGIGTADEIIVNVENLRVVNPDYKDRVDGDHGDNRISVESDTIVFARGGNDVIAITATGTVGQPDVDFLNGGVGTDTLEVEASAFFIENTGSGPILRSFTRDQDIVVDLSAERLLNDGLGGSTILREIENVAVWGVDGAEARITGDALGNELTIANELFGVSRAVFIGGAGNDTLIGGSANDVLDGGADDDYIEGQDGDDLITAGSGTDIVNGGAGTDILQSLAQRTSDTTLVANDNGTFTFSSANDGENSLRDVEYIRVGTDTIVVATGQLARIRGTSAGETLTGTDDPESIYGLGGTDLLIGRGGADVLVGSVGNDRLEGGAGADVLIGGTGARDRAEYRTATSAIIADLSDSSRNTGDAEGDTYTTVEDIWGTGFDDEITGDAGSNWLYGRGGNDDLIGAAGRDRLFGGIGDDTLDGGEAGDTLDGGFGNDMLIGGDGNDRMFGGDGDDTIFGGDGNDTLSGGAGTDILDGGFGDNRYFGSEGADFFRGTFSALERVDYRNADSGVTLALASGGTGGIAAGDTYLNIDWVTGSNFDDDMTLGTDGGGRLYGLQGNDILTGRFADDRLYGGSGNDLLSGGANIDRLFGQAGNDVLDGGTGNDKLSGGTGADLFVFIRGGDFDTINDFEDGTDLVDLRGQYTLAELTTALAGARTVGASVNVNFGNGDIIQFRATDIDDITLDDFLI